MARSSVQACPSAALALAEARRPAASGVRLSDSRGAERGATGRAPRPGAGRVGDGQPDRGGASRAAPCGLGRQRRRDLAATAEAHGASRVRVFGSVARGQDGAGSDVDLLVDLPPGLGLLGFVRLLDDLERVLEGLKVDLVPEADLKPEIRARV